MRPSYTFLLLVQSLRNDSSKIYHAMDAVNKEEKSDGNKVVPVPSSPNICLLFYATVNNLEKLSVEGDVGEAHRCIWTRLSLLKPLESAQSQNWYMIRDAKTSQCCNGSRFLNTLKNLWTKKKETKTIILKGKDFWRASSPSPNLAIRISQSRLRVHGKGKNQRLF